MELKKFIKKPTESKGLEVVKKELVKLHKENYPISISEFDLKNLEKINEVDYVGVIMGDVENILKKKKDGDLWFVNKEYLENNYKEIK